MSTIYLNTEADKIPKPDVKVDYPWHEIEAGANNQTLDVKKYYPQHLVNGIEAVEINTIEGVVITIVNNLYEPMPNVAVELRSDNYTYCLITDEYGNANFPYVADDVYMITLAKKDSNMESFFDVHLDETQQKSLRYVVTEQNIRDGWYADTAAEFYVDELDGGNA